MIVIGGERGGDGVTCSSGDITTRVQAYLRRFETSSLAGRTRVVSLARLFPPWESVQRD